MNIKDVVTGLWKCGACPWRGGWAAMRLKGTPEGLKALCPKCGGEAGKVK